MQEQETIHAVMAPLDDDSIKSRILTIRGVQVILDRDIAFLYGVETKVLNQAVKRNRERFPDRFMFQLTEEELGNWKSQIVTSNPSLEQTIKMGVRRAPYAFTEQGVAMLSAVLKSETAIRVSIQIMDAFSAMRRALASIAPILSRLDVVERRQITDQQRNEDSQKFGGADVLIATTHKSATKFISPTAVAKFNKQNPTLTIKTVGSFHDRFLILDGTELYHLNAPKKREPRFEGEIRRRRTRRALKRPRASMKDLGRQYCAITKMDAMFIPSIMQRIP